MDSCQRIWGKAVARGMITQVLSHHFRGRGSIPLCQTLNLRVPAIHLIPHQLPGETELQLRLKKESKGLTSTWTVVNTALNLELVFISLWDICMTAFCSLLKPWATVIVSKQPRATKLHTPRDPHLRTRPKLCEKVLPLIIVDEKSTWHKF